MKKLVDVTDRKTRPLQQVLMAACGLLVGAGYGIFHSGNYPPAVPAVIAGAGLVLLVVTARIKQRWEIDYRGHRIRLENSPVTAERLYLDEGLVAKGGVGKKTELRAPIRVGEAAGETIVALADSGIRDFRLRLFVETEAPDADHAAAVVQPTPAGAAAIEDLKPVTQSAVLGKLTLVKHAFEFLAAVVGLIGGLAALATWLL